MKKPVRIAIDILLIVVGIVLLVLGINDAIDKINSLKVEDSVRFQKSYPYVDDDNRYKYVDLKSARKFLEKGTGVLLVGNTEDSWTQVLVRPLDEQIKNFDIDIQYLETNDLAVDSKEYKNFPIDLDSISTPHIIFVKDGDITEEIYKEDIFHENFEGAPIEYFDEERLMALFEILRENLG